MPEMTPAQFVAKWRPVQLAERAASQEHFIDLCRLLGQPTPAEHDATGAEYTFERGVAVTGPASAGSGGQYGFADVWWRGKFGWEYKRRDKHRTLDDAYRQLCQYREALENPPLLIVSDIARIEIHTNFTGTAKQVHTIGLDEMTQPHALKLLRRVFTEPMSFEPKLKATQVTEEIARQFATLATRLRERGHDPQTAAHFLMKCMFCLFAEDVGLLPNQVFKKLLETGRKNPKALTPRLTEFFDRMRTGGSFGVETIIRFNGGLFDTSPALELTEADVDVMIRAAGQDWSSVEPAIFGTLFERSLDPNTRAQIGAHYTSRDDIMLVVGPVIMAPLRREWDEVKQKIAEQVERRAKATSDATKKKANAAIEKLIEGFIDRLSSVRILDPACGSGNFLYVAIQQLLDLEKEVITFAAQGGTQAMIPQVRPTQLHGIEISPYAAELAQVVIWIGYLQWMRDNGFRTPADPVLEPFQTIECRDAILKWADEKGKPIPAWREGAECIGPADWPDADFIIGNPPFLGSKLFREHGLADSYVDSMYRVYELPGNSDLCCYWFDRGRRHLLSTSRARVGLLATQGIRGAENRAAIERIKNSGDIFLGWSDRPWILEGAAVRVSIIGFDSGIEQVRWLDGLPVPSIHANLTSELNLTSAVTLRENEGIYRRSPEKGGKFELEYREARSLLDCPNPNGKPNSDVLSPWINARGITSRYLGDWIIDFDIAETPNDAAQYEKPFAAVLRTVRPARQGNRDDRMREMWWRFRRSGDGVRSLRKTSSRLLCTPMVAKHRLFVWVSSRIMPDKTIPVFARSDDYFFGLLHSSLHEHWALRQGTQLEDRPRYTPTSCFETFPLPWPPGHEDTGSEVHRRISEAAAALNEQRERWLNPPEWIGPIAAAIDAEDDFADVPAEARPLIRESAIMAAAAKDAQLKRRTLTNLYNERPTWLRLAHEQLDRAVLAAYAAVDPEGEWEEDWAEVWVETGAGQALPDGHALAERRKEIDQRVLANLLRLNLARATAQNS